jgi:hypothetical protein
MMNFQFGEQEFSSIEKDNQTLIKWNTNTSLIKKKKVRYTGRISQEIGTFLSQVEENL